MLSLDELGVRLRSLWLAVIQGALDESRGVMPDYRSRQWRRAVQQQAKGWVRSRSPDFQEVCCHAGVDPEEVRREG